MQKWLWLGVFMVVLVWSGINPKDQFTWFLEVFPALIGFVLILLTYRKFPLTPLLYMLILIHMIILMVGGHYTYAEVPLFDYIKEVLHQSRNNYDKLGHFFQGFEPAILAREILIRKEVVKQSKAWLNYIVLSIVLAFSAFYELFEWWVALATGEDAEAFLGMQGYAWDTQSDMMYALVGGITALLLLSRWHDRQIKKLKIKNWRVVRRCVSAS
jgi:putative membrane protein